jgi:MFS family permease
MTSYKTNLSPKVALALVSFFLGELGDGLNIFQGIYLVALGWNEGSVGIALSMMGFTALLCQTFAGDVIDKTHFDRRTFLTLASLATAFSASAILFVHEGNVDHAMMYSTKVIEGISSSFIGPCVASLTLATFGPDNFDEVMASNILWGHVGSIASAILAGLVGYFTYPDIKYCFLVIGFSAICAVCGVQFLPAGDPLLGRGLQTQNQCSNKNNDNDGSSLQNQKEGKEEETSSDYVDMKQQQQISKHEEQILVSSYWSIFLERKTVILCLTGFFFHFANANVLLVLGELMGGDNEDGSVKRSAIPLIAGAIVLAQLTMSGATYMGDVLTKKGCGRKPLFLAGLLTLPIRCGLIILWKDAGDSYLLSTQILDGIGGGFFGLLHPYLVNDIAFGSGRFNVLLGLTASCFGLGATLSNLLGQIVVEKLGHVASLTGSLLLSIIPIALFSCCMPETLGQRGKLLSSKEMTRVETLRSRTSEMV